MLSKTIETGLEGKHQCGFGWLRSVYYYWGHNFTIGGYKPRYHFGFPGWLAWVWRSSQITSLQNP
ncbi:MAG: hypothetical protein F6J87_00245 [Spirulina sp. SIO3F2]|nr:hypothetical protein [Spirulina sp. SIO3F2]